MEIEARSQRAMERRFRCSRLQAQPSIDAFHFHRYKSRMQAKPCLLRRLDLSFLAKGTNIVHGPGVGLTKPEYGIVCSAHFALQLRQTTLRRYYKELTVQER